MRQYFAWVPCVSNNLKQVIVANEIKAAKAEALSLEAALSAMVGVMLNVVVIMIAETEIGPRS